jgi:hypothetical protein
MVSLCSFEMTKKIVELLCILGQVGGDAFKFIGRIFVSRSVCQPVAFYGDLAETLCNLAWHTLTLQPAVRLGQSRFRITKGATGKHGSYSGIPSNGMPCCSARFTASCRYAAACFSSSAFAPGLVSCDARSSNFKDSAKYSEMSFIVGPS